MVVLRLTPAFLLAAVVFHAALASAQLEALSPGNDLVIVRDNTPVKRTLQPLDFLAGRDDLQPSDEVVDVLKRGDVVTVLRMQLKGQIHFEDGVVTSNEVQFFGVLVSRGRPGVVNVEDMRPLDTAEAMFTNELKKGQRNKKYDKDLFAARARVYVAKKDFDKAIGDANEALKIDPRHEEALLVRSVACRRKGYLDKAVADATEALEGNPKCDQAYLERAAAYQADGQPAAAIENYMMATQLNPLRGSGFTGVGEAYKETLNEDNLDPLKFGNAIASLDRALQLDPADYTAAHTRAQLWQLQGDAEKAIRDAKTAVAIADFDLDMVMIHIGILFNLRRYEETIKTADQFLAKAAKSKATMEALGKSNVGFAIRCMRAESLCHVGQASAGLAEMNKVIADYPSQPVVYKFRALVYRGLNDPQRADADIRRAEELTAQRKWAEMSPR